MCHVVLCDFNSAMCLSSLCKGPHCENAKGSDRTYFVDFQNKVFVYRGQEYERLSDFNARLQNQFPNGKVCAILLGVILDILRFYICIVIFIRDMFYTRRSKIRLSSEIKCFEMMEYLRQVPD